MDELRILCEESKPHVISINETWLDQCFIDQEITIPGYNIIRLDRDRFGGGLAVYISEHLSYKQMVIEDNMQIDANFEAIS